MKKMLLILNPATGGGRLKNNLLEVLCRFAAAGYELCVWPTRARGDARRIALEKGPEADVLVCCGGDGTLNEVADALMKLEKRPQLGYIPAGTTCDFATSLHLPKTNMAAAAERIVNPKKLYRCDVGLMEDKAFVYVAAFGAFADVAYTTPQKYKNALGYAAYILEGIQRLPSLPACHARIECEQGVFEDDYLLGMFTNSTAVAGFSFPGREKVRMNDGLFEVLLVKRPQTLAELGGLSAALLGGPAAGEWMTTLRFAKATFTCEEKTVFTLDGEYGGAYTQANLEVRRGAIEIRV